MNELLAITIISGSVILVLGVFSTVLIVFLKKQTDHLIIQSRQDSEKTLVNTLNNILDKKLALIREQNRTDFLKFTRSVQKYHERSDARLEKFIQVGNARLEKSIQDGNARLEKSAQDGNARLEKSIEENRQVSDALMEELARLQKQALHLLRQGYQIMKDLGIRIGRIDEKMEEG